jgi:hypothetical protein
MSHGHGGKEMKLRITDSWIQKIQVQGLFHPFSQVYPRKEKDWEIDLPFGFEYLLHAEDAKLSRVAPTVLIGPAGEQAKMDLSLFPLGFGETSLRISSTKGVPAIQKVRESWNGHLWKEARSKNEVFQVRGGEIAVQTDLGPYYLRLPQLGATVPKTLEIRLPPLIELKVEDPQGKPIPEAEVFLQNPRGDHWQRIRQGYWRSWFHGKTDGEGKIALPLEDAEGGRVRVGAFGFLPKTLVLAPKSQSLVLQPDTLHRVQADLSDAPKALFGNGFFLKKPCAYRPRFLKGEFLVPDYLIKSTIQKNRDFSELEMKHFFGDLLLYWAFSGEQLDLRKAPKKVRPEKRQNRLPLPDIALRGRFSLRNFDASSWNRKRVPSHLAFLQRWKVSGEDSKQLLLPKISMPDLCFCSPQCLPHLYSTYQEDPSDSQLPPLSPWKGIPSALRLLEAGGEAFLGARLNLFLISDRQGKPPARSQKKGGIPSGMGHDFLPDQEGWVRLGLPKEFFLDAVVAAPGKAPHFVRLSSGQTLSLTLDEEPAWLWLKLPSSKESRGWRLSPLSFSQKAQNFAVARRFPFLSNFHAKPIGGDVPAGLLVGPLPGGRYRLARGRKTETELELKSGRLREVSL